ncbi:hypothetical protein SMAC4_13714 [Sordaria macrospora]|uniref:uncharacterized protein n=1 Tax=Sordaria macrospora TaxID=5147 RepID=UPI002B2F8B94|nr:hypothetical protein SMAC4_13714 [Sordaria macrospora]
MSTPSPSGPPQPPPPAIVPVTPLPDSIFVLPPPSTTAQSAKRARTADEEARPAHATTATSAASGPITSFAETLISEALAKAEVYRSFAAFLDTELARFSAVSPAHAREADRLARTITAALQKNSASSPSPTPATSDPAAKNVSTPSASKGKGPISYADAAARGTDSTSASASRSTPRPSLTRKAAVPQSDGRVFLRLDRDSPFVNTDAFAIRKEVQTFLRLAPTDIPGCHKVPTGFALVPKDDAARQTLMAHKDEISSLFGCIQVEVPKKWVTYAVPNVPMTMRLGMVPVDTTTAIKDEVLVQTGQEPVALRPSQSYHPGEAYATWLISFDRPVSPFRLFDASNVSRLVQKRRPLDQCTECFGWHGRRGCARAAKCPQCGRTAHGECDRHTQCANCCGPFESTHVECPMRPRRQRDTIIRPTPHQQREIRQKGGTLFTEKHNRAAPSNNQENTPTSPDELSKSNSSDQSQPPADEDMIVVQLSEYASSDNAVRRSSRHKTPSKRADGQ